MTRDTENSPSRGTDGERTSTTTRADADDPAPGTAAAENDDPSEALESAAAVAGDGREASQRAETSIEEIALAASEVRRDVSELEAAVDRITETVAVIEDIADRTSLLALNANIEAARAGSGSEGFAVVADEVKQLAEEANDRTAEISDVVASVESSTEATVSNLDEVNEKISEGMGATQRATRRFREVEDHLDRCRDGLVDGRDRVGEQADDDLDRAGAGR
jgi:methyl-accepting chemotaxis protein